ncbi:hypothetical protein OGM84_09540 [Pediococcus acidilactici]
MKLIILGLLLVLAVLALMVYIKRRRVSKAATIVRNSGETIVDEAMGFVAEQMRSQGFVLVTKRGTSVADVWFSNTERE